MDVIESLKKYAPSNEVYRVEHYEVWIDMVPVDVEVKFDGELYTVKAKWDGGKPGDVTSSHGERDLDTAIATVRWPEFKGD